ncbi:hypothetical protein BJY01DRAFT_248324 [Aspergillus pseudoustus]|uniref:Fungal N-terminal domain-containing protein n=1 Tax=Aspergillus pseudoustus TaxID=1810923 RepID=A0ABR4JWU7_9EURO
MSSNITGCQELSCDDSPLSMTGSIIGILTFAYAIAITAIFYANAFLSAETERGQFQSRLKSEVQSLELVLDLLRNYAPMVPDTDAFARKIEPWLVQAARSIQEVQPRVILVPGGGDDEKSRRWRFLNRARFVGDKEQLSKDFADIAAKRTQLEGVYQGVMTRYRTLTI